MTRRLLALWCLATSSLWAAPSPPADQALAFLNQVRTEKVNLQPNADTAISAATTAEKVAKIKRRLTALGKDLRETELRVIDTRVDDTLAAVLIEANGGLNPRQRSVIPVALIQRGASWHPAPLPGSFANTSLPYDPDVRKRSQALETWMLEQSARVVNQLREQALTSLQQAALASFPVNQWETMPPNQVLDRFLLACRHSETHTLAALTGGLAEEPPAEWSKQLDLISALLSPKRSSQFPNRWLTSTSVLLLPIPVDDPHQQTIICSIAVLDPAGTPATPHKPALGLLDLELSNEHGQGWLVKLPDWQHDPLEGIATTLDDDLMDSLAKPLDESCPPTPQPSVKAAGASLLAAMRDASITPLLQLMVRPNEPAQLRRALLLAANQWNRSQGPNQFSDWRIVDCIETPDRAVLLLHAFPSRNLDDDELLPCYLIRQANGWVWSANPDRALTEPFQADLRSKQTAFQQQWRSEVARAATLITELDPTTPPPSEATTRQLVKTWQERCQGGDPGRCFELSAKLNLPDSDRLLVHQLGLSLQRHRSGSTPPSWHRHTTSGPWSVVTMRETDASGKERFPVLVACQTPQGPRLLVEFDWLTTSGGTRELLNKTALKRITRALPNCADALERLLKTAENSPP